MVVISKLTKKGLTEVLVGQMVKDMKNGDLTVLTELIDQLPKKMKIAFLPETLSQAEIKELLELALTDDDINIFK